MKNIKLCDTPWVGLFLLILFFPDVISAQIDKEDIMEKIEAKYPQYVQIAQKIWESPELGFQEHQSAEILQVKLEEEEFGIQKGVAQIPTAFVASYGSGKPVIAILGEYDALPGMSQKAIPKKAERQAGAPGHACGHHLFGTGSMAAAIAVKNWLDDSGSSGTIRFYGTPAEEGGSGKVYMVRAGLFDDVDAVLSWHPGDANQSNPYTNLATISGKFRFRGNSAHAAAAPEKGRSALDGVEAMNTMVNMLREHTTESTRIHYIITHGGDAPNIVPSFAEVYYVVRHENKDEVKAIWNRVVKTAQGAAVGTETEMTYEIIGGTYDRLPNDALAKLMHDNMSLVGGIPYDPEELEFARAIVETLGSVSIPLESAAQVQPMKFTTGKSSADTGDVSWNVPTQAVRAATWVPGTPAHSWQAVAAGGMSIGHKGMMVAAKTIALSAIDLFSNPELLKTAREEFHHRRGINFQYEALLGNRKPALDYRN